MFHIRERSSLSFLCPLSTALQTLMCRLHLYNRELSQAQKHKHLHHKDGSWCAFSSWPPGPRTGSRGLCCGDQVGEKSAAPGGGLAWQAPVCPPPCLPLQKWAPWCEDLLRPSHHLQHQCSLHPPAVSCCCCCCCFGGAREMSPPMYENKTHFRLHQ